MQKFSIISIVTASLIGFAIVTTSFTDPCAISGKVTKKNSTETIPYASLKLFKGDSLVATTTSDVNGTYCFTNVATGKYKLEVNSVGSIKPDVTTVAIAGNKPVQKDIHLAANSKELQQVQILADEVEMAPAHSSPSERKKESYRMGGSSGKMMMYNSVSANDQDYNTEEYSKINDNDFKETNKNALSTFSIDVDRASYSNVRRFINQGSLPPADAVRVEEMINYFSYDYPQPKGEDPFSITTEYTACPWNKKHQLIHIGLQGKEVKTDNVPANNLVFLLDVSGSMESPDKLPLLKSGLRLLIDQMRPQDHVAIVVYAGAAGLVLPSTSGENKEKITEALEQLQAGGSTAGGEGIILAYKIAKENFLKNGNNRIILATDGDFNIGASSDGEMVRLIEEKREHGIFLTVLGFGTGNYKDSKMEQLADKGNGNYAYIDNLLEANKVLVKEMGATLLTIAKDVKIQIEFNPAHVKAYRLVGYENRLLNNEDFNDDKKDAGELGSGHTVTAMYEIIPADSDEQTASVDPLKYQKTQAVPSSGNEVMTIKFRYKAPNENTSKLITKIVSDKKAVFGSTSENCRFSSAVAEFGMLLRDSKYKGEADFNEVLSLARASKGKDDDGYRAEFIRIVEMAQLLKK
ncbi:MAG: von Willebrand factor type A domain-containing protein [Bacteroidota bacterium]